MANEDTIVEMSQEEESKENNKDKSKKARYWAFIMYEESMPEDAFEILSMERIPIVVSPLHDRDIDKDGCIKKPHYHVMIWFDGPTTMGQAREISDKVNGTKYIERVKSLRGYFDYFTHKNEKDSRKVKYDEEDITYLSGATKDKVDFVTEQDKYKYIKELTLHIRDNEVVEFIDLAIAVIEDETFDSQMYKVLVDNSNLINILVRSQRHKLKDEKEVLDLKERDLEIREREQELQNRGASRQDSEE